MKTNIFIFLVIITLILPSAVRASEETEGKKSIFTMDEVLVTATKTEEKRKDITNSVIIVDENDIIESPAQSVGELLANKPGIDWRTRGNYGGAAQEIHIRGMGGDATQVMVNGVVLNSPSLGLADVSSVSMNNIDRIEVVKGPGSLLYGSGAMGGTVNIITKSPQREETTVAAAAGFGTQDRYRISAESGSFIVGDTGYYLTANRQETNGFRPNSDLVHNDISLKLIFDKEKTLDASLYGEYVDREYGLPGPKPPTETQDYYVNGVKFYDNESASLVNRGGNKNFRTALDMKKEMAEWLNARIKADYSVLESYNFNRYSWSGAGEETWVTNTVNGVEGNLSVSLNPHMKLVIGAEYRNFAYENEQQDLNNNGVPTGSRTGSEHNVYTRGLFSEVQIRPFDFLRFYAGYRHERHSKFGYEDVSRFGLVVNLFDNTVFKVNHGKHFKAPTMNDLYWPDDGFMKGNTDLRPETGWHTDLTVEQSLFDDRVFTAFSYFNWDINDKIDWAENPAQPTAIPGWNYWTPLNLYSNRATGWEFNVKAGPYKSLLLDFSLTLLDAQEEKVAPVSRQALYTPDLQFKSDFSHFADFGLTTTVTARYTEKRPGYYANNTDTLPQIVLPSYWTVDIKLDQVVAEHWRLSLWGNNLFNSEYDTYLASFRDQNTGVTTRQPYPGAGRSVFLSASYEF